MSKKTSKSSLSPSLATPSKQELALMDRALYRERQWYEDTPRFLTNKNIQSAIKKRELRLIDETKDLRPIARFNASVEGFTPYLTSNAKRASKAFGSLWRVMLEKEYGIVNPSLRLAVTSMVRTQKYQDTLVKNGRFASPDSTHCTGNAFDIDLSGYYVHESDVQVVSHVDPRRRKASQKIGTLIARQLGETYNSKSITDHYDERITHAALLAAEVMYEEKSINMIHEFKDTPHACLHVAVNPNY